MRFVYLFDSSSSKPETSLMDFRYRSRFRMRVIGRRVNVYTRTSLLYICKADVYANDICKRVVTDTCINYPKYDICGSIMNVHVLI